jgi:hypothetical protein
MKHYFKSFLDIPTETKRNCLIEKLEKKSHDIVYLTL